MLCDTLDHKAIGHLRRIPGPAAEPCQVGAAVGRILGRLAATGHVERREGLYRRSRKGEEAVAAYDAELSPDLLKLMRLVAARDRAARGAWGLQALIAAGLVGIKLRTGEYELTDGGRARLDPNRDRRIA